MIHYLATLLLATSASSQIIQAGCSSLGSPPRLLLTDTCALGGGSDFMVLGGQDGGHAAFAFGELIAPYDIGWIAHQPCGLVVFPIWASGISYTYIGEFGLPETHYGISIPAGPPSLIGFQFAVQTIVIDNREPGGFSMSNGLQVTISYS